MTELWYLWLQGIIKGLKALGRYGIKAEEI
jgi:hypothetical protein